MHIGINNYVMCDIEIRMLRTSICFSQASKVSRLYDISLPLKQLNFVNLLLVSKSQHHGKEQRICLFLAHTFTTYSPLPSFLPFLFLSQDFMLA